MTSDESLCLSDVRHERRASRRRQHMADPDDAACAHDGREQPPPRPESARAVVHSDLPQDPGSTDSDRMWLIAHTM